jgi:gliding motility-associated-like protein
MLSIASSNAQQNLITNSRFEETNFPDSCFAGAFGEGGFYNHFIKNWWGPIGSSPDYYHRCDVGSGSGIPNSALSGYQEDYYLENAYVGMITYVQDYIYQEYVCTKLIKPLIKNKQYIFKLLVSSSDNYFFYTNIGFCLEKDSIEIATTIHTYIPTYSDNTFMCDSAIEGCELWKEIEIAFSPTHDSLQYLIIGTFPTVKPLVVKPVSTTATCIPDSIRSEFIAYHLIDDVRLYCLDCDTSSTCAIALPDAFTPNADGLNDEWKPLIQADCTADIDNYLLRIFNRWGEVVFTTLDKNETWKGLNNEIGTYVYYLQYDDRDKMQIKQGNVELIR